MRALLAISLIFLFLSACQAPRAERRHLDINSLSSDRVTVVCALRHYVVGSLVGPSDFKVLKNDRSGLRCSVDAPFRLVQQADANLVFEVRGFVFQITEPARYSGHILTAHFDGVGRSGDPFKAFAIGKRYLIDVPPSFIDNLKFQLCY